MIGFFARLFRRREVELSPADLRALGDAVKRGVERGMEEVRAENEAWAKERGLLK